MSFTAPLDDMKFVLDELVDLTDIANLDNFKDESGDSVASEDTVTTILDEAGKFASGVLAPLNHSGDVEGARLSDGRVHTPKGFKQAYTDFQEAGWNGLSFPIDYGGSGLPYVVATPVQEMWHAANMAFGLNPLLTQGAVEALIAHASDELKETFLPKMVSGEWTGTMNLTEPQAGSDLAAVKSRAEPEGDHYKISGQKIFITYGDHDLTENIIHLVLARLPDAPDGVKGISLFVVPKFVLNDAGEPGERNDVNVVAIEHKLGIHASPTAVLSFGDEGGATGYLVGEPHEGLKYMFTMMNLARHAVGVQGVSIGERAYQQALAFARDRVQGQPIGMEEAGRHTIIHHPDVRRMLLVMKSNVEAMRAMIYYWSGAYDIAEHHGDEATRGHHQKMVDFLTPIVKGWCTEKGNEIASIGVQIHGGMGFIEETGAAQHMRDARITTIYEGTTGIQAADLVGRKLLRDGGEAARTMIEIISETDAQFDQWSERGLDDIRAGLAQAIDDVTGATEWMLGDGQQDPRLAFAASVPYMRLWGLTIGGWLMARSAIAAKRRLDAGSESAEFNETKIATARFFALHVLPEVASLASVVTNGSEVTMEMAAASF